MFGSVFAFRASALAVSIAVSLPAAAFAGLPDSGLVAAYSVSNADTNVYLSVCGTLPLTEGCYYGGGIPGSFGHVGAIIEGSPSVSGDTVTRGLYIVDVGAGATGDEVVLYRYLKTDKTTKSTDQVSIQFTRSIKLPLVGGANVRCSIAGNAKYLFIGTDKSLFAVRVAKGASLAMGNIGGFSNNPTVSSITSNSAGYVVVSFGTYASGGTYLYGPDGQLVQDGGLASFTLTPQQGFSTKDLPTNIASAPADFKPSIRTRSKAAATDTSPEAVVEELENE